MINTFELTPPDSSLPAVGIGPNTYVYVYRLETAGYLRNKYFSHRSAEIEETYISQLHLVDALPHRDLEMLLVPTERVDLQLVEINVCKATQKQLKSRKY